MSYREVDVIDVKEIVRRLVAGAEKKRVARELGLSPCTVRRYAAWLKEAWAARGLAEGSTPSGDEVEALVREVVRLRKAQRGRPREEAWLACVRHRERIRELLKRTHMGRPLELKKVGTLLRRETGARIPYKTLHRFAVSELGFGRASPTIPVKDGEPGKELQIDTGWVVELAADAAGRRKRLKAWIFTAAVSRHRFVYPCERETTAGAIAACEAAWEFFGGVFEVLIPDNTKAIVEKADQLEPLIVRAFREYAQSRDFLIDTTRVRRPTDKPRVERAVQTARNGCFAGEAPADLEAARKLATDWCLHEYGSTTHGTTHRRPLEHFEAAEKPRLRPAPEQPYDVPRWQRPRVGRDQHATVASAVYSLPAAFVGKKVDARADRCSVRFYVGGELVKSHPRMSPGERSTDASDFPAERFATAQRDTGFYLARAREQGEAIGQYAEALLASPLPWTRFRFVHALLRLPQRYGVQRVESVCKTALEHAMFSVKRLERMIEQGGPPEPAEPQARPSLPPPRHLRPARTYALPCPARKEGGA